jgi:hypothetical protein
LLVLLQELRDFVAKLLVRNPSYRLGSGPGGVGDIMKHAWWVRVLACVCGGGWWWW